MEQVMNRVSASHPVVEQSYKYACLIGDRKGQLSSMFPSCGSWPLQCQIIDRPARQGVLIWNEVSQVGNMGYAPVTTCKSLTLCLLTPVSAMLKDVD